ncbi:MAG: DUF3108 domain-containing protein [candidate division KSB1 bacterium]|nr:DUF3108 domain-containing protein [candidate division KSB1 bacterium]
MTKKRMLLLALGTALVLHGVLTRAQDGSTGEKAKTEVSPLASGPGIASRALPFGVGEKLSYQVRYGRVNAGSAEMRIEGLAEVRGHLCFRAVTTIESNSFFSRFYTVRDYLESLIDSEGVFPWAFEKRLHEGKYRAHVQAQYDHASGIAVVNGDTVRIPAGVQDVLSIFYYVRTQPMEVGKAIEVANHDNKKVAILELRVLRRERVRTEAGEFDAFVIEPRVKETGQQAGLFRQKGEAWIWFSADSRRLPVLIKSKMYFGSLTLELAEVEYLTSHAMAQQARGE